MNKMFQIVLGVAVLLISSVVAILGFQEAKKKDERVKASLEKARKAKEEKRQLKIIENGTTEKDIEHRPSNG